MNYIMSFIFCGFICIIGQLIYDHSKLTPGHITSLFVVIGTFLDIFHIYDKLISYFHAGALIPITSFGHSLMHGVMKSLQDYGLLGIFMGMFDRTAAGIVAAIIFSFIIALTFRSRS